MIVNLQNKGIVASVNPIKYMGNIFDKLFFVTSLASQSVGIEITNKTNGTPKLTIRNSMYQSRGLPSSHGKNLKLSKTTFKIELLLMDENDVNRKTNIIGVIKKSKLVLNIFFIP